MSKSSSRRPFRRSTGGAVTVIEAKVHRSYARNARLAFVITALVVGLLSATVAADQMHPVLAAILGGLIGIGVGSIVWAVVRIWPIIRLIWWWLTEISIAFGLVYGWMVLAAATNLVGRLLVVGLAVGVPAGVPVIRKRLAAWAWCLIVRHRLRVCFAQFIIANQSGSLPLILWAKPTPVGERIWVYLRPGLSQKDLEGRLDKIAATCHGSTALVERASERNSAYLRFDIKRREVLTATVDSPLPHLVGTDTPATTRPEPVLPTALDLPDVPTVPIKPTTTPAKPAPSPRTATKPATATAAATAGTDGDDISDWI